MLLLVINLEKCFGFYKLVGAFYESQTC